MSDQQPVFTIEKLYIKDLSVEVPNSPAVFMETEGPNIELQLNNAVTKVSDDMFDVVLTATVTAKAGDKVYFLVEAGQAGVFTIRNVPETDIEPILGIACPNILFPYLREAVSDAVNRAGFPPVILTPVNFEALYQQRVAQEQAAPQGAHEIPIQ